MNFKIKCKDRNIDGTDLVSILKSNNGLTKFGKENSDTIIKLADIFLNDFYVKNNSNIIDFFCQKYDYKNFDKNKVEELKRYFPSQKDFNFWKKIDNSSSEYEHYLFSGVPLYDLSPSVKCESVPSIISVALQNQLKKILRECENTLREEMNIPKVGEGWVSETELFYKLCNTFSKEEIIHHARPIWLRRQHLDIYFPKWNIAIEYQGRQHLEPVEYFGGEESFQKQKKRDANKKRKCSKNKCTLIYAYENYDYQKIVNKIKKFME